MRLERIYQLLGPVLVLFIILMKLLILLILFPGLGFEITTAYSRGEYASLCSTTLTSYAISWPYTHVPTY